MRILLLNNLPTPYFTPLFQRLARLGVGELTICFATDWKSDLGWAEGSVEPLIEAKTIYLSHGRLLSGNRVLQKLSSALKMLGVLWRERPDYLICYGYTLPPQFTLLLWGLLTRTPFAVIGDANIHCDKTRGVRRVLKLIWLRLLTRQAAAILTIGTANRHFWDSYGTPTEKIFRVPFAVDNDHFVQKSAARKPEAHQKLVEMGLDGRVIFISVGRLIERKNISLMIEALRELSENDPAGLLIVGTGEERRALEDLAGDDPRIVFAGGITPTELPLWYAMADVMILAAQDEPWGLVTNEAMASGLAIIAHRECGSTVDLVDEQNGIVLEGFEVAELATAMRRMIRNTECRRRMQKSSRKKIEEWTIDAAAAGVASAIRLTCHQHRSSRR